MTEFQIKEDGRTMIPSVFSHAGKKELVLLQYPQLQALDMVKTLLYHKNGWSK